MLVKTRKIQAINKEIFANHSLYDERHVSIEIKIL
jgi:hypothetical protein